MKHSTKKLIAPALMGCLLAATSSWGAEVYLHASTLTKDLPGKLGVLMWGFGTNGEPATVPGPQINMPGGDTTLIVHLKNNLSSNVSLVIPNQNGFVVTAPPTVVNDAQGRPRARSFVKETAPGATETYTWNNLSNGTYLYYSGSHASLQVQMGLYGAMVKKPSAGEAYPGVPVASETVLLFSEIDTKVHDAVNANDYGPGKGMTSTIRSIPDYFLINGQAFTPSQVPLAIGTANQTVLLRMLNASVNSHIPVAYGLEQRVIAEDGRLYPYARNLNAPELPALKTMDVLVTSTADGTYPLYDRALGLVNGTASSGGMLTYLEVAP